MIFACLMGGLVGEGILRCGLLSGYFLLHQHAFHDKDEMVPQR